MTFNFTTQMTLRHLSPMPMNTKLECKDHQIYSKMLKKICKKDVRLLCEKCQNAQLFLVRIFPYSVQIQKITGQKKLRICTLFTQWAMCVKGDINTVYNINFPDIIQFVPIVVRKNCFPSYLIV